MDRETERELEQDGRRGRAAEWPHQLPRAGWGDILWRIWLAQFDDRIGLIAAGVAFYALTAVVPGLVALVSVYAAFSDPAEVTAQVQATAGILPEAARILLQSQLHRIVSASTGSLSLAAIGGLLITLWTATAGMRAMLVALDVAYHEPERRGYFAFYGMAFLLTLGALTGGVIALSLVALVPALVGHLGLGPGERIVVELIRWPLLTLGMMLGLAVLYRLAPDREDARWRWISWGSVLATTLWIVASVLFSLYVSHFSNFNKTYGSLGAVMVLLMWLYISAYAILLGAELNAEMEHQTAKDSTTGPAQPIGERGARVADTLGKSRR